MILEPFLNQKRKIITNQKTAGAFNDDYIKQKSEGSEKLSIKQYFKKIEPNLCNMIDKLKELGEWEIHLTMKVNFIKK